MRTVSHRSVSHTCRQAVVIDPVVAFSLRPAPGRYSYVRMSADDITWEEMSVAEYLKFKERLVNGAMNDDLQPSP